MNRRLNDRRGPLSALGVAVAVATALAVPAFATWTSDDDDMRAKTKHGSVILKGSDLIGRDVHNLQDEDLGKIEDLAIDARDGSVAYAVVSYGGFLGMGDKLFAIPFQALRHDKDKCRLNIEKAKLENAPGFDKDKWPDLSDRVFGEKVHEFYGVEPSWRRDGTSMKSGECCDIDTVAKMKAAPRDAKSFDGTVTQVNGHAVTVKTDDRNVQLHLAPTSYLTTQNLRLTTGDEVEVKAVECASATGLEKVLIATEVRKGDQVIVLRNSDGTPVWRETR